MLEIEYPLMLQFIADVLYILSPTIGFVPQLYKCEIVFSPLLSILVINCNMMKILHYNLEKYNIVLLYQSLVIIFLHLFLISKYTRPFTNLELYIINHKLCYRHGLLKYTIGVVITFTFLANMLNFISAGFLLSKLACVMDVFITFLQLVIYKDSEDKPLELFYIWLFGDAAKILSMVFIYVAPIEYTVATVLQMAMNAYVVYK